MSPAREKPYFAPSESSRDPWMEERDVLLLRKICDLGLKVEGTYLQRLVDRLYEELEQAGISMRPPVFLSDEWGCPEGIPAIGIPFYLADERLMRMEEEVMGFVEALTEEEILKYLRHEMGHAFNYAYRLYDAAEWHELFGPYSRPYLDNYRPNPFSLDFVRHLPGWYAQKHPDEDFSETFAVWLSPQSDWRERYRDWGCYPKLLYIERIVGELGRTDPPVSAPEYAEQLACSLADYYQSFGRKPLDVPAYFDGDLKDIFKLDSQHKDRAELPKASDFLLGHRRRIISHITYWTGLNETAAKSLIDHLIERAGQLQLRLPADRREPVLMEFMTFVTTLCMNRFYRGNFVTR